MISLFFFCFLLLFFSKHDEVNFINELGPLSRVRYRSVIGFTYPNLLSKTGKRETAIRWKF